ncbi:uncharacterized protein LOC125761157 [Anopheles funestus]|uniref:uncharacterized protein LOC125761157 n=1 Tax=Anopheles funestus TaxID=62324 RepID=UPI0020C7038F|nr:uncharacterized protein LOC125761157 [Anopheles funestus]
MCSFAEQSANQRDNMCWCFEEISLMLLVQRILMYLWYRLLLKMFPRLSVLPNCHECSPRRSLPCGQLADEYWKASYFSRTLQETQSHLYKSNLQQPFPTAGFCKHIPTESPVYEAIGAPFEQDDEEDNFNFNCSDISHVYQSTFLDDYDECLLAEDIAWDMPVPEIKPKTQPLEEEISLLLNDYYIDDDLNDHLQMATYQTAIGDSFFGDSWID